MKLRIAAILTVFSIAGGATAAPLDPFTGFVAFGDSFSDAGRFGDFFQPPSNKGRFTDGRTWAEYVGDAFEARNQNVVNMAVGGATAGDVNATDPQYAFIDSVTPRDPNNPNDIPLTALRNLSGQATAFADAGFDMLVGDNPLVSIMIGGNDVLQGVTPPADIIGRIAAGIVQIASNGPEFDSFLVANLPDFSQAPDAFFAPDFIKEDIRNQSIAFNAALSMAMSDLAVFGIEVEIFDLFGVNQGVYADAVSAGLVLDDACVERIASPDPLNKCLAPGSSADFLFIDNVHPGDFAHTRWADAALSQIGNRLAPVPLPAGFPLLIGAVAGLGLLRLRRAA